MTSRVAWAARHISEFLYRITAADLLWFCGRFSSFCRSTVWHRRFQTCACPFAHRHTHTQKKKTGLSPLLHFHCHTKNAFSTSIIPHFRFWLGQRVPVHDVSNSKRPPSSTFHHIRLGTPWWKRRKLVKPFYMQLWLVCGECWCLLLFFFNLFLLSQKKIMEAKWSQKTKEGHEKKIAKYSKKEINFRRRKRPSQLNASWGPFIAPPLLENQKCKGGCISPITWIPGFRFCSEKI